MTALELSMFRRGDMLVPSAEMFREDLHAVAEGKEVMVRVWMARNPKQDRWFWAMLTELVSSGVFDGTKEALHRHLNIALGLADPEVSEDGKTYWVLRSTSPASMDKLTFTAYIRNIEQYVAERWGTDINELRKAVRSKAGADAEPKWNQEPETAGTPPVESEGEAAGGPDAVPGVDDAASPIASAPRLATATKRGGAEGPADTPRPGDTNQSPATDTAPLWAYSRALDAARDPREAIKLAGAHMKAHPELKTHPRRQVLAEVYTLHLGRITGHLSPERAVLGIALVIDNGEV